MQHSPSVVIPPHAPLSPLLPRLLLACYPRYPFRNTVVARGAIDAIDFRGVFLNFPKSPSFLYSLPHFFPFSGGKYRNYCIYCRTACFEPKFDQRVKKRSVAEVLHGVVNLLHEIPCSVLDWWSGWGCRWCCAIVWCNRSWRKCNRLWGCSGVLKLPTACCGVSCRAVSV